MSLPTPITDHAARMAAAQLDAFKDAVKLKALTAILGAEVQRLADFALAVRDARLLANAVGVQLDRHGRRTRLGRTSADDTIYRARIRTEHMILASHGGSAQLQEVVSRLMGAAVQYRQIGTATAYLQYVREPYSDEERADISSIMRRAACSGVAVTLVEGRAAGKALHLDSGPGLDDGELGALVHSEALP